MGVTFVILTVQFGLCYLPISMNGFDLFALMDTDATHVAF